MEYTLKCYLPFLLPIAQVAHIIYLALLVAYHENDAEKNPFLWMFSDRVDAAFYITTNIMPIVLSSILYVGIFWVSRMVRECAGLN